MIWLYEACRRAWRGPWGFATVTKRKKGRFIFRLLDSHSWFSVYFSHLVMSDSLHPMDSSMPGLLIYHQLPEFTQTHVHWVGDDIQPSHHLSSPSPFDLSLTSIRVFSNVSAFDLRWQSIGTLASVLPMNIQGWFPLGWTDLISLLSKGLSKVFSNTTIWKHQFFGTQSSLWSNSHIYTWLLEKP